jgi:hypothetical protein
MSRSARTAAAAAVLLVGIGATSLAAVPAAADQMPGYCTDSAQLPRSADAAATWLEACTKTDRQTQSADAAERKARSETNGPGRPWTAPR